MTSTTSSSAPGPSAASNGRIDLSLDRIKALLERLEAPQDKFPVIHIAGTNGKGSVSAYLDALLQRTVGVRTGRFNSPHLREPRDCCRLNGDVIAQDVWARAGQRVTEADAGESGASLHATPFELLVARMFLSYALLPPSEAPAVLIVEVGLGGRLDATNVFSPRNVLASIIAPVDRDHEAQLGRELSGIALHKAGIIPAGGLCVIADQRRAGEAQATSTEVDLTCLRTVEAEQQASGEHAATVLHAVREAALERGARLVKGYAPWSALEPSAVLREGGMDSATTVICPPMAHFSMRYAPTLFPSVQPHTSSHFVARTGDGVVGGPGVRVPATRAALTGAAAALQALFSIARDEPPSAFVGAAGSDRHEELKLQIAFALREEPATQSRIQAALDAVQWEGRCSWLDVDVPSQAQEAHHSAPQPQQPAEQAEEQAADGAQAVPMAIDEPPAPEVTAAPRRLRLLVDGAHNEASAVALRQYVDLCLAPVLRAGGGGGGGGASSSASAARTATVTWLLGFSHGKDVRGMLRALLAGGASGQGEGQGQGQQRVRHRVAFLRFRTPVDGMPWVAAAEPQACIEALSAVGADAASGEGATEGEGGAHTLPVAEARAFDDLPAALAWAADGESELTVLAGSLYLVADLYRLCDVQSAGAGAGAGA